MGQRRGGHCDREGPEEPDWSSPEEDEEEASGGDRDFGVGGDPGRCPGPIFAPVSHSHPPGISFLNVLHRFQGSDSEEEGSWQKPSDAPQKPRGQLSNLVSSGEAF